jgi:hypothetical protein
MVIGAGCTIPVNLEEVPRFDDMLDATAWVERNIRYENDTDVHGKNDYWQFPQETLELRSGDCEDHAILLMAIALDQDLGDGVRLAIGNGTFGWHAWVVVDDRAYDAMGQSIGVSAVWYARQWDPILEYTWEEVEAVIWFKRSEI